MFRKKCYGHVFKGIQDERTTRIFRGRCSNGALVAQTWCTACARNVCGRETRPRNKLQKCVEETCLRDLSQECFEKNMKQIGPQLAEKCCRVK